MTAGTPPVDRYLELVRRVLLDQVDLRPELIPVEPSGTGFVIVDDYLSVDGCRRAVDDYRGQHGIDEEIVEIDWSGVYWRRDR